MSDLIDAAIKQLKKTPEIRVSSDWKTGRRHSWFPSAPSFKLNTRTVDALIRRKLIAPVEMGDPDWDWRWTIWRPTAHLKRHVVD